MASSLQKLYRVIVTVKATDLECKVTEYHVLKFTDKNFVLRYETSGQKTRMVGKEELMKVGTTAYSNDTEQSASMWALDDQITEATEICKEALEKTINRNIVWHRKQLVNDHALLKSLKKVVKLDHRTIEKVMEG